MVPESDLKNFQLYRSKDGIVFEKYDSTIDTLYIDDNISMDSSYAYAVTAVDYSGNESNYSNVVNLTITSTGGPGIPSKYCLFQNYPNPFNPQTTIRYGLKDRCHVRITIYDILGQKIVEVINTKQNAGYHQVLWDGKNFMNKRVGSGIYIYKLETENYTDIKKMLLIK